MTLYEYYERMKQLALQKAENHKKDSNLYLFYVKAAAGFEIKKSNLTLAKAAK